MKRIAFTSIATNYLPKARVLAHSLKRHAKDTSFVLVLAEPLDPGLLRPDDPFDRILTLDDLGIPDLLPWLFTHTVVEACTAIKGFALAALLDGCDDAAVLYFDPDIVVTSSLDALFAEFGQASILLTPHGTEPETELQAIIDNEISHLRYGVYNLGFIGVRNTHAGRQFSRWWLQRLRGFCYEDFDRGIFTDQRWVDLAPGFFEEVKVLRDPGYNVATWNLSHRVVDGSLASGLRVNGRPLVFYHFSGFDSGAMATMLGVYGRTSPILEQFRQWYVLECEKMGQRELGGRAWLYSRFDNGEPITTAHRHCYRDRKDLQVAFRNPFSTTKPHLSFRHWYTQEGVNSTAQPVSSPSDYEIVVFTLDHPDLESSLTGLIARTANTSFLKIVGTAAVCDRVARTVPQAQLIEVSEEVALGNRHDPWLLTQISASRASGLVFVHLGLEVPELWDLRLHWYAKADPGVVTVSPLHDGAPLTALLTSDLRGADKRPEDVDRLVCNLEPGPLLEAPAFLHQCFYVNTEPAQSVLSRWLTPGSPSDRHASLSVFARQCTLSGYSHLIAARVYVGPNSLSGRPHAASGTNPGNDLSQTKKTLAPIRSRYSEIVALDEPPEFPTVAQRVSRRQLHVSHNWGGGLWQWVRSYCTADTEHVNLVLRPVGPVGFYGSELELYADVDASSPIARWTLPVPIKATVPANMSYRRIVRSIVADYGIDAVFVSSLIGHSLDVLDTGRPTVFICHDFFPLTPEIYLRSRHLSGNRVVNFSLEEVYAHAPLALFPNFTPAEAAAASSAFKAILRHRRLKLVAPSPSTQRLYLDLVPELLPADISVIPHGTVISLLAHSRVPYSSDGRLRIAVPGRIAPEKGCQLLGRVLPELAEFADILLLGSSIEGQRFADTPGVRVIPHYEHERLPALLADFRPHVGFLASDFPETFSYTLDELMTLGVPPLAVRIGALEDRIREGENGFLVDNTADAVLKAFRTLDVARDRLERVRRILETATPRTAKQMIRDYERLLDLPRFSDRALSAPRDLPPSIYAYLLPHMHSTDPSASATPRVDVVPPFLDHSPAPNGSEAPGRQVSRIFRQDSFRRRPRRLDPDLYSELIGRIRETAAAHLPKQAVVAVVSKGDDELLQLGDRRACHFPQAAGGGYAGYHPATGHEAIAHFEALRSRGITSLLLPSTAFWWLEYYREFKRHLDEHYVRVVQDDTCVIYSAAESGDPSTRSTSTSAPAIQIADNKSPGALDRLPQSSTGSVPKSAVRLIALYLPQFHPIPENDAWWGLGFTEWRNVTQAKPLFPEHYQPHLPTDLGFYDLRVSEVRSAQAELAREHGIHGFCYYHYWFSGKRLLERPFDEVRASGQPDFPFCLCWANDPWSRRWNGREDDLLQAQTYSHDDDMAHIHWLLPALADSRAIRIEGKPAFLVYRGRHLPDPARTVETWRREVHRAGLPGIYLLAMETSWDFGWDATAVGFDATVLFQPQFVQLETSAPRIVIPGKERLKIYDYQEACQVLANPSPVPYRRYETVLPGWDNTPRVGYIADNAVILHNSTPAIYEEMLRLAIARARKAPREHRIVFINAWNEWGEGCHLEPDLRHGKEYLEATRSALRSALAESEAPTSPPAAR